MRAATQIHPLPVLRWLFSVLGFALLSPSLPAETLEHEGGLYQVERVPFSEHSRLQLRWLNDAGQPLSNFGGLQKQLMKEGKKIRFATNASIYERGPRPNGLMVCEGRELVPINLADGFGNFFLKPNGVFFLDEASGGPAILETTEYVSRQLKPRFANQSGPLLLRKGVIHPAFQKDSPNRRQRSAVGFVAATQEIVFVMSDREARVEGRVTFHQLARVFCIWDAKTRSFWMVTSHR